MEAHDEARSGSGAVVALLAAGPRSESEQGGVAHDDGSTTTPPLALARQPEAPAPDTEASTDASPAPAPPQPAPGPTSAAAPTQQAPTEPAATPGTDDNKESSAVPTPPALTIPDPPFRPDNGVVNWWAKAFPHVVWLSVVSGLAGQVYGFAEMFGSTPGAWIAAAVLGGTFEFMMVACSSRGLRAIGLGRAWTEVVPFLLIGTIAAALACLMNVTHFELWLGIAAGTVSGLGYAAHVFSHLYDELEHRALLIAWRIEKAKIEQEIERRTRREHREYEERLALMKRREQESELTTSPTSQYPRRRTPAAAGTTSTTSVDVTKSADRTRATSTNAPNRSPGSRRAAESPKATKADALRIGRQAGVDTPAPLKRALLEAGLKLPQSATTIETWCTEIKKYTRSEPATPPPDGARGEDGLAP
ncbi:MAG: hypothetical protein ACQEXM_26975 [Actinomycetota bacterium]